MRIEYKYNPETYRKELEEFMRLSFKPFLKDANKYLGMGLVLLIFTTLELNWYPKLRSHGYIFIALSSYFILQSLTVYYTAYKEKRKYRGMIKKDLDRMSQHNQNLIMEFNEDDFYYEEKDHNSRITWQMFQGYRVINDYIFLDFNRGVRTAYIVNKKDVGENDFLKILEHVSKKLNPTDASKKTKNPELIDDMA